MITNIYKAMLLLWYNYLAIFRCQSS